MQVHSRQAVGGSMTLYGLSVSVRASVTHWLHPCLCYRLQRGPADCALVILPILESKFFVNIELYPI
jgi:hypothetical protein